MRQNKKKQHVSMKINLHRAKQLKYIEKTQRK